MTSYLVPTDVGVLAGIDGPADVRGLGPDELDVLADEIRERLIDAVAATGGHLGSNLGAVELTLALHRAFDSPTDALIWDTGHQAYVHKMVTGRHRHFEALRQRGGLSGYPSRAESPHDLIENSHASTALGYAFGLALGRRHRRERGTVVAIVGDGSLTGGVAYEALGNIGCAQAPVVVVLNDNGRSYAPTVSRLSGPHGTASTFFESLGLAYVGPVDGHDIAAMEKVFGEARAAGTPVVVHVLTRKGRGYRPAEDDPVKCMHDTAPFDPETGAGVGAQRPTYTDAFGEAMVRLGEDERVFAITAAMPGSTGLSPFAARFPDRFVDVGIAEQQAVTAAAGLAMAGARPVVAIYSTFLNRAWDQVYYDVGLHGLPVVFCIDRAGVTGDDGASHHGVLDLALLTKVPGMTVLAPSSFQELEPMLRHALTLDGPVALRWPKGTARQVADGDVGRGHRARRLRGGRDACLLAVGKMVGMAEEAAELLARGGVEAEVWDVRCARPLDEAMLGAAAQHRVVVTAEDGIAEGGVGWRIADALGDDGPAPSVLGVPTRYLPHAPADELLADMGLDAAGVASTVLERHRA